MKHFLPLVFFFIITLFITPSLPLPSLFVPSLSLCCPLFFIALKLFSGAHPSFLSLSTCLSNIHSQVLIYSSSCFKHRPLGLVLYSLVSLPWDSSTSLLVFIAHFYCRKMVNFILHKISFLWNESPFPHLFSRKSRLLLSFFGGSKEERETVRLPECHSRATIYAEMLT